MSRARLRTPEQASPARPRTGGAPVARPAHITGRSGGVRVVAALVRLEGWKLVRHPVFLAGVGLALLGSAVFVAATVRLPDASWSEDGWTAFAGFGLLGLLTMVATSFAALRDSREHTEEQHGSLPVGEPATTGGLLLATVWPAVVSAVLLAAVAGYAATITRFEGQELVHLAERVADVVMFGALGVAVARWLPSPFVAPLVAWGLLFVAPSESPSSWQVLSPFAQVENVGLAMWHLAYVVGLTVVWSAAALLRRGPRPSFLGAGILGLALVTASLVFLLPEVCPSAGGCLF